MKQSSKKENLQMSLTHSQIIENGKAVNTQVSILNVLASYGLSTSINGYNCLPCPSIVHEDKHPSAKYYPKTNSIFCFAEAKSFTPLSIVQEREGISYVQAYLKLAEEYNVSLPYPHKAEKDSKDIFPLKPTDYAMLGITNETVMQIPVGVEKTKDMKDCTYIEGELYVNGSPIVSVEEIVRINHCSYKEADDTVWKMMEEYSDGKNKISYFPQYYKEKDDTVCYGLRDLWKNDREAFTFIVGNKANEALQSLIAQKREVGIDYSLDKLISRCEEILKSLGANPQDFEIDFETEEEKEMEL